MNVRESVSERVSVSVSVRESVSVRGSVRVSIRVSAGRNYSRFGGYATTILELMINTNMLPT